MYKATLKDKIASVRIISATFDENPSVNNIIGDKGNRNMKIKRLAEYAFIKSLARKGAFISKNKIIHIRFLGTVKCFKMTSPIHLKWIVLRKLIYWSKKICQGFMAK